MNWLAEKIEQWPTAKLLPYARNARTLRGLTQLLEFLPTLKPEEAAARVKVLWDALADLEARGTAAFYGSYKWG